MSLQRRRRWWLPLTLCLQLVLSHQQQHHVKTLEDALFHDMFPPSSDACTHNTSSAATTTTTTTFSFHYTPQSPRHWSPKSSFYEPLVFLVEMQHHDDDDNNTTTNNNPASSWTLRLGRGGQVYSLRGAYGEAIPPQSNSNAAFMDTVLQMVAVNQERNQEDYYSSSSSSSFPYFIHQAGAYAYDDDNQGTNDTNSTAPPPFYSPTLAVHCVESHCDVASWGQQAHLPTLHRSDVLYYVRYQNCGNGVLEMTQVLHNAAEDATDILDYLNVPWTGLRHSTFHSVLLSSSSSSLNKETNDEEAMFLRQEFPLRLYGDTQNVLPNLKDTGGFTTMAQGLPPPANATPFALFCVNVQTRQRVDCMKDGQPQGDSPETTMGTTSVQPVRLVVARNDSAMFVAGLSRKMGYDVVRMELSLESYYDPYGPTITGCRQWCGPKDGLMFVHNHTGFVVQVQDVIHWVYQGRFLYFAPTNVTVVELNQEFVQGDEIQVRYGTGGGLTWEDNLALTFVHGVDETTANSTNHDEWHPQRPSRLRYGGVLDPERNALIYTVNVFGAIAPRDTFLYRQFLISGKLSDMEEHATRLVPETRQTMWKPSERRLTLRATNTSFFIVVGENDACHQEGSVVCVGSSTPSEDELAPLFYISCGKESYVGSDQYYFAPSRESETDPYQPYLCRDTNVHPTWTLLGYFRRHHCRLLANLSYTPELC